MMEIIRLNFENLPEMNLKMTREIYSYLWREFTLELK